VNYSFKVTQIDLVIAVLD